MRSCAFSRRCATGAGSRAAIACAACLMHPNFLQLLTLATAAQDVVTLLVDKKNVSVPVLNRDVLEKFYPLLADLILEVCARAPAHAPPLSSAASPRSPRMGCACRRSCATVMTRRRCLTSQTQSLCSWCSRTRSFEKSHSPTSSSASWTRIWHPQRSSCSPSHRRYLTLPSWTRARALRGSLGARHLTRQRALCAGPFAATLARQLAALCTSGKLKPATSLWKAAVDSFLLRAAAVSMEVHEEVRPGARVVQPSCTDRPVHSAQVLRLFLAAAGHMTAACLAHCLETTLQNTRRSRKQHKRRRVITEYEYEPGAKLQRSRLPADNMPAGYASPGGYASSGAGEGYSSASDGTSGFGRSKVRKGRKGACTQCCGGVAHR